MFPVYEECQLTFLDPDTDMGSKVSRCIVQTTMDDDCATDEEIMVSSQKLMKRELEASITKFIKMNKAERQEYVRNS